MRVEIMIDKEQKISQATREALETELYRNHRLQEDDKWRQWY